MNKPNAVVHFHRGVFVFGWVTCILVNRAVAIPSSIERRRADNHSPTLRDATPVTI